MMRFLRILGEKDLIRGSANCEIGFHDCEISSFMITSAGAYRGKERRINFILSLTKEVFYGIL